MLFGYAAQVTPILVAFSALAAFEIPVVSLLLPWPPLRYILLALGVWGLLWMLGLLASLRVHPHVVSDTGLRLRSGAQLDLHIPWHQIRDIRQLRSSSGQKLRVERSMSGGLLSLQKTTNLEATLCDPLSIRFLDGHSEMVDTIRFYADAPTSLLASVALKTTGGRSIP
jgi:hypothetical protein